MAKRIKNVVKCIMLPEGSTQAKKYSCIPYNDIFALVDNNRGEIIVAFEKVEKHTFSKGTIYITSFKKCKRIVWFNYKKNIVVSAPFTNVIKWLNGCVILNIMGDIKIMEYPEDNSQLIFKTPREFFGEDSGYMTLYTNNYTRVLIGLDPFRIYPKEFTEFESSTKAGLIVVKHADSDKRALVRLKDYAKSEEYDNVWLYKFLQDEASPEYVLVKDGGKIGIMRTDNFQVTYIDCKRVTPINNEFMFIHNDDGNNIIRLTDAKISKW